MEQLEIQAFIPHRAVKPFLLPNLPWLARLKLQGANTLLGQPGFDRCRDAFRSIVVAELGGRAVLRDQAVQYREHLVS